MIGYPEVKVGGEIDFFAMECVDLHNPEPAVRKAGAKYAEDCIVFKSVIKKKLRLLPEFLYSLY